MNLYESAIRDILRRPDLPMEREPLDYLERSSSRELLPTLKITGEPGPYSHLLGEPVTNEFGVVVGSFKSRGKYGGGDLVNSHGFVTEHVSANGTVTDHHGHVTRQIERRPLFSQPSSINSLNIGP